MSNTSSLSRSLNGNESQTADSNTDDVRISATNAENEPNHDKVMEDNRSEKTNGKVSSSRV